MGMVMIKCPQSGRAIPTGIEVDRERFRASPVFFSRTRCPVCHADHAWFAREAWVHEPAARAKRRRVAVPALMSTQHVNDCDGGHHGAHTVLR